MDKKRPPPTTDLAAREKMLENRSVWLHAHESAAAERDAEISDREQLVQMREAQLEARREVEAARAERERLLVQIRDVNEQLVLALLQAQKSADDANAARAVADDNAARFGSLILTLSSVVWRATADGRIDVDREAWRKFTGAYPADGEWGWLEAIHPSDRDRVRDAWRTAVASAQPYGCRHRIRSRRGGHAWVIARAVPITRSGVVREWIGILTDVSDSVRVEEAREQFIGILGHDLRNPLASILASIDLLRTLPEPHARTVARVARSAHRIEALIRDLLDFSHGRLGGGIPIAPRPCDLRLICEDGVEEIKQVYSTRVILFSGIGDLRGEWDPDRIEQVVSNLVGNAVIHGADPITVTSRDEGDVVVTSVHNEGPPIPETLLPTLFEPFTKATQDAQDRLDGPQGLGLGLYIAHEIVHAHGGTLVVSSSASEGTTFKFALPRRVLRRARTTGEQLIDG
jgi:signal transduction histidine kinase